MNKVDIGVHVSSYSSSTAAIENAAANATTVRFSAKSASAEDAGGDRRPFTSRSAYAPSENPTRLAATMTEVASTPASEPAHEEPAPPAAAEPAPPPADKPQEEAKPEPKPAEEPKPKLQVHKLNFEKDVVYLYQFSRTALLPSLSPYCLKVETWLRLAGLKYEVSAGIRAGRGARPREGAAGAWGGGAWARAFFVPCARVRPRAAQRMQSYNRLRKVDPGDIASKNGNLILVSRFEWFADAIVADMDNIFALLSPGSTETDGYRLRCAALTWPTRTCGPFAGFLARSRRFGRPLPNCGRRWAFSGASKRAEKGWRRRTTQTVAKSINLTCRKSSELSACRNCYAVFICSMDFIVWK